MSWGFYFKNLTITKDEQPIGQVSNAKELKEGRAFTLPDGKTLSVQLKRTGLGRELEILINGKPVPGSPTDPLFLIKTSFALLLFIGAFNIIVGVIIGKYDIKVLDEQMNMGAGLVIAGALYVVLAFLVKLKHSLFALYIAIALLALDIIFILSSGIVGTRVHTSGVAVKIIFILQLTRTISAIKKLKKEHCDVN